MARKSYAELQTLLADNTTGDISPADLRDMLDSLAIERAVALDLTNLPTTAITTADVFQPMVYSFALADIGNSENVSITSAGVIEMGNISLYDIRGFLRFDGSGLGNNAKVAMEFWYSEDNVSYVPFSSKGETQVHSQSGFEGTISISTELLVNAVPRFLKVYVRSSITGALVPIQMYLSIKSNQVIM